MNSTATTTFEIDSQSGQHIANIGGDQTIYYGERSGAARTGKILGALGLLLSLVGAGLFVLIAVITAHSMLHAANAGGLTTPYTQYVPSVWPAVVGLLVGGFVVKRVARIVVGR